MKDKIKQDFTTKRNYLQDYIPNEITPLHAL